MTKMRELSIEELVRLEIACSDVVGYLTDNSCDDPDCCGGPYYTEEAYNEAMNVLNGYGLTTE